MNRGEVRTMARSFLNEAADGFWLDTELDTFIQTASDQLNQTIQDVKRSYMTVSSTFPTVANTRAYAVPSDFVSMVRLEHYVPSDVSDVEKIDEIAFPRIEAQGEWPVNDTGKPWRYFIRGEQIEFIPIPDKAYDLRIYYNNKKTVFSADADIPAAPPGFHDMIAVYTAILAKEKNEQDPRSLYTMYDRRETKLLESILSSDGDDPEEVEGYLEGRFN